jgi:hypothetical protein
MLSMSNAGHHQWFRCPIAKQLVSNNDTRFTRSYPHQLAKKRIAAKRLRFWLDENIGDNAVLIDGSAEVVSDAVDLEEDFIQMPFVVGPGASSSLRTYRTRARGLIADHHSACSHHFFYIANAHAETEVEPNAFRNDLPRVPMATVGVVQPSSSIYLQK